MYIKNKYINRLQVEYLRMQLSNTDRIPVPYLEIWHSRPTKNYVLNGGEGEE